MLVDCFKDRRVVETIKEARIRLQQLVLVVWHCGLCFLDDLHQTNDTLVVLEM